MFGKRQPEPNMIQSHDGRIWTATAQGVVWIDPKRMRKALVAAPAVTLSLVPNSRTYDLPTAGSLTLPPGSSNLRIAYTSPALSIPERVRFRYLLERQDKKWTDAGSRREAFYTNLDPGRYRLRVGTSLGDGGWIESAVPLTFVIQPTFFQTVWFKALCACAFGALLWMIYLCAYARLP